MSAPVPPATTLIVALAGLVAGPALVLTPLALPAVQVYQAGHLTPAGDRLTATDALIPALFAALLLVYLAVALALPRGRGGRPLNVDEPSPGHR